MDGNQIIENLRAQQSGFSFYRHVEIWGYANESDVRAYAPGVDALPY